MSYVQAQSEWIVNGHGRALAAFDMSHFVKLQDESMTELFIRFDSLCWRCEKHSSPIAWEERAWNILVALRASDSDINRILRPSKGLLPNSEGQFAVMAFHLQQVAEYRYHLFDCNLNTMAICLRPPGTYHTFPSHVDRGRGGTPESTASSSGVAWAPPVPLPADTSAEPPTAARQLNIAAALAASTAALATASSRCTPPTRHDGRTSHIGVHSLDAPSAGKGKGKGKSRPHVANKLRETHRRRSERNGWNGYWARRSPSNIPPPGTEGSNTIGSTSSSSRLDDTPSRVVPRSIQPAPQDGTSSSSSTRPVATPDATEQHWLDREWQASIAVYDATVNAWVNSGKPMG